MSISKEVIAFINLKICEILKQNWYKYTVRLLCLNPNYAFGFCHESLIPFYELEQLLPRELPAKYSATLIFTQSA